MAKAAADWVKKAAQQEISNLVEKLDLERKEEILKAKNLPPDIGGVPLPPDDNPSPPPTTAATASKTVINDQIKPADGDHAPDIPDVENLGDTSLLMKIIRKGLVETKLDLEVQRKDPTSPLYSVKSFEALDLKPNLLKGVYGMGFNKPSQIQETALPILLANPVQNLIAQSQSGTGKTAAFVLAMLSRVNTNCNYPQVICISPTYELAIQTGEVAARMAKYEPDIKIKFAVRGEEISRGSKLTEHIIIGTPGKIMDWGIKYHAFDLKKICAFVLDEADVMIATQGHHDQCIRIHKQLMLETCQIMFFSATYGKDVMEFARYIVPSPTVIRLRRDQESLDNIKQYFVKCSNQDDKYTAIQNIYGGITIGQAIIFCQTRRTAGWLAGRMSSEGHSVGVLSGDLTVEQRLSVLDRFRGGLEKVLITTNVLSRGIDIEQVTIVVNFDLPLDGFGQPDCETYLHRIGRTGRFGKKGIAINLVDEKSKNTLAVIEKHFQKNMILLNVENYEEIENIDS